jgi:uncharacterized protein YbjT (DUF2867 family)
MTSPILLTGGTGTLGRLVAPLLVDAGHTVRILTRGGGHRAEGGLEFATGDLATGAGVDAAVEGVETIVHCAGGPKGDDAKARHLVQAAARAGTRHIVYISVVGADRVPVTSGIDRARYGYFASKRAAELIVADSGVPFTTLRATQFHNLVATVAEQMARLPVLPTLSGVRFQPVDARDVAERLAGLALGAPAGLVSDMGGPRAYPMADLLRGFLAATGRRRRLIVPIRQPGRAAKALREGANLALDHAVVGRTWEEFLAQRFPAASRQPRDAEAPNGA